MTFELTQTSVTWHCPPTPFRMLASNELSGDIPPILGDLTDLRRLDLSNNIFTGSLPLGYSRLSQLSTLSVPCSSVCHALPTQNTGSKLPLGYSRISQLSTLLPSYALPASALPASALPASALPASALPASVDPSLSVLPPRPVTALLPFTPLFLLSIPQSIYHPDSPSFSVFCLAVHFSVCPCAPLPLGPFVPVSLGPFVPVSLFPSVTLSPFPSVPLSICLSATPSAAPSSSLSNNVLTGSIPAGVLAHITNLEKL
ncbi:unnamed protein product [Closterium sp. Yama58-4]|nr:unnamed protein product [Closterium sp. Yama58-4]